ncbi:MAG TPA: YggS family pyridoxal phosphate-dependent enzyme [Pyrinomonadaceae bacterium]|nr:YggS family pyridoxal phosphate-dependent enzyme [Pyrinomonadaceae bacterium]
MAEASHSVENLRARLDAVRLRVERAARRAGREAREVTLIAVSKTHPTDVLRDAVEAGATDFGENRVQEAESKIEELGRDAARWHLIGHLQANKARRAVKFFDLIHTIDTPALVTRLERLCVEEARETLDVLVQVDLAGEATKSGAPPAELDAIFETLDGCRRVRCRGLMLLPPFFEDTEQVRPYFRRLRELRDEWAKRGRVFHEGAGELSMGMSHDFEVAIEEGATMVRVGTAIFGAREKV